MTGFWLLMVMPVAAEAKLPAQGARGQALFFDETAARPCGSCHALVRKGTAVGPSLTRPAHPHCARDCDCNSRHAHAVCAEREAQGRNGVSGDAGSERGIRRPVLRLERYAARTAHSCGKILCRCVGQRDVETRAGVRRVHFATTGRCHHLYKMGIVRRQGRELGRYRIAALRLLLSRHDLPRRPN